MTPFDTSISAFYEKHGMQRTKACNEFLEWYQYAQCGDRFTYYRGAPLGSCRSIRETKKLVWHLASKGYIYLFQKRHGKDDYEYMAQKALFRVPALIPSEHAIDRSKEKWRNKVEA